MDRRGIQPQLDQRLPDQPAQPQSRAIRPVLDMPRDQRTEAIQHGVHDLLTDPIAALPDRRTDRCHEITRGNTALAQPRERSLDDSGGSAAPSGVDGSQSPAVPCHQQQWETIRAPDRRRELHLFIGEGQHGVGLELTAASCGIDHPRAMDLMRVEENSPLQSGCAQHPRTPLGVAMRDKGAYVEFPTLPVDRGRENVPDAVDIQCAATNNL
jgi:hypothetical protein